MTTVRDALFYLYLFLFLLHIFIVSFYFTFLPLFIFLLEYPMAYDAYKISMSPFT